MNSKETLKKLSKGELNLKDFAPTLILIKTADQIIPENPPLSEKLIEFLIRTSGDGLPSVIVFYNNGEITL